MERGLRNLTSVLPSRISPTCENHIRQVRSRCPAYHQYAKGGGGGEGGQKTGERERRTDEGSYRVQDVVLASKVRVRERA